MKSMTMCCTHRSVACFHSGLFALGLSLLGTGLGGQRAHAQSSVGSTSIVGVTNGGFIGSLDRHDVSDNSTVTASATQTFTGLDRAGDTQTMTFSGTTISRSDYGSLHVYTTGSLLNSYYNASNAPYADHNGNFINPAGSPTSLTALGFATFGDTLQYGGTLQAGYKARYIFHIDGTNSGTGAAADLAVDIDGAPGDSFFDFDPGHISTNWATKDFDINGITPQTIHVQFSDQVVFDTFDLTDGQNYSGTSDFSSTATLAGIQVVDAAGNPVSGWTVTSGSGTVYPMITPADTPEPGVTALLLSAGVPASLLALRRRRHKTR
ncbi:MAG: hypothetical protein JWN14_823 [Chthonomonadales bacterium]|nr:hypothetical protein [Chthonomonadales bacterium]